ncbi:MAG: TolC family protein [Fibrobacter sp.]|nr:TolC family protein [Fibrobacter sp.]
MMKNEIGIIITIILFICIHKGYSHSLKETVELALKSNPDILAVKEKAEESKLDAKSTFRSILPDIKIHASYRHVTEKADIEFPEGTPLEDINLDLSTKNTYETGLTANYLLFSGFAQKNMVKVKNQTTEIRNTQLEKTEKKSAFEVIAKYRQIQGILLEIDALKASAKRIELQKKRISSLIEQGMALSLDTLSLSLSQLNNEQEIIAADAKLKTAYQELSILTGEKIITDPEIKINFE